MRFIALIIVSLVFSMGASEEVDEDQQKAVVLVVSGAPGEEKYGELFETWSQRWLDAAEKSGSVVKHLGLPPSDEEQSVKDSLKQFLESLKRDALPELWIVMVGHGSFDGRSAKFNLIGPDISADELSGWLEPFSRPIAVINASSSSAPFMQKLAKENRVIITSTKSGYEQNFSRFGEYLSVAILDLGADLDKDGQTSLLEAYLTASRNLSEYYKKEGLLETEHPLLDDDGDGQGTPGNWFRGVRVVKKAKGGAIPDGLRSHQFHLIRSLEESSMSLEWRLKRDQLEQTVEAIIAKKEEFEEESYFVLLEPAMLQLAEHYGLLEEVVDTVAVGEAPTPDPEAPTPDPEAPTLDPEAPTPDPEAPTPDPEAPILDPEAPILDPEAPILDPEA
jgi:hypothetical protein